MNGDMAKIWSDGFRVKDVRNYVGVNGLYGSGVGVVINDAMPADQIAMLPSGEVVMGHAKYAALMKNLQSKVSEQIYGALTGAADVIPREPDPEEVVMTSDQLWGAF